MIYPCLQGILFTLGENDTLFLNAPIEINLYFGNDFFQKLLFSWIFQWTTPIFQNIDFTKKIRTLKSVLNALKPEEDQLNAPQLFDVYSFEYEKFVDKITRWTKLHLGKVLSNP